MTDEPFPVSEKLTVIEGTTIFKSDDWWSAVLLLNSFGRIQIATYLWNRHEEKWKRRQKFVIQNKENWEKYKDAIESLLDKI